MAAESAAAVAKRGGTSAEYKAARAAESAAPAAQPAPAAPPAPDEWGLPLPDLSGFSLPGDTALVKALVVLAILIVGLTFYSRVTGKPILLALNGPSAGNPQLQNPNTIGVVGANTMAARIAAANPARVGA